MEQYIQQFEAVKVENSNLHEIIGWLQGIGELRHDHLGRAFIVFTKIRPEDPFNAIPGQWIVRDALFNYKVYREDVFQKLFSQSAPSPAKAEQEGPKPISSYLREYSQLKEYEKLLGGGMRPEYTLEMVRAMGWQEVLHMLTGYDDILNLMDRTIYVLSEGAGEWEIEAGDWKWKFEMVFAALKELTDLKAIKAQQGETPDYLERKPKAWEVAKQLTTGYKIEKREQEGLWEEVEKELFGLYTQLKLANAASKAHSTVWLWKNKTESTTPPVKVDYEKKYKEANQFIIDLAKELGQEGLGYDDLSWTIEDFMVAARTKFEAPVKEEEQKMILLRELPEPVGKFIEDQADVPYTQTEQGAYWHYVDVITLLTRYRKYAPPVKEAGQPVDNISKEEELIYRIVEQWGNAMCSMGEKVQWLKDYAAESRHQPAGESAVWVKGDYERLFNQIKGGKRTVCYIDHPRFFQQRDICTIKPNSPDMEFTSRGQGYGGINDPGYCGSEIERFIQLCRGLNAEWLDESAGGDQGEAEAVALLEWLLKSGYNPMFAGYYLKGANRATSEELHKLFKEQSKQV